MTKLSPPPETAEIGRLDLLLILLGSDEDSLKAGVGGITRLQKYLFLLETEERVRPTEGFGFEAYKAGPYSARLYDDLEFLENLGLIQSTIVGEATPEESVELERVSFDELLGAESLSDDEVGNASDIFEERRFRLTPSGREKLTELLSSGDHTAVIDRVQRVKSRFRHRSLSDLLYYIYTKYPEMATESEIRDKVLSRRR